MNLDKFTTKAQAALSSAQEIARRHSHQELDGEHLLLALAEQSESIIPPLLQKLGVQPAQLQGAIERDLAKRPKVQGTASADLFHRRRHRHEKFSRPEAHHRQWRCRCRARVGRSHARRRHRDRRAGAFLSRIASGAGDSRRRGSGNDPLVDPEPHGDPGGRRALLRVTAEPGGLRLPAHGISAAA